MSNIASSLFILSLLALVAADLPVEFDIDFLTDVERNTGDEIYRIPEDLDPIHYEVEVTPYFDVAPVDKDTFTFDGRVTLTVRAIRNNISSLIIQENVREIENISLTTSDGIPVELDRFNPFERIRAYHFLSINLAPGLTLDNNQTYLLTIEYIGNINETPLQRGVFRGNYRDDNGVLHWYAATHLQPVNSRQAFPSFDEPGFKSTFDIIINRPANFTETFSNMPINQSIPMGDRVREIFYRTPRMSAYLVTFHISEQFTVIADNNDSARSFRVLARPNARGQGEYALEIGPPINDWLESYLGIDYYSMADNMKNDQIASPYWASGATENWGLVTYREQRLLFEEGETNLFDKMYVGTIIAHELAHKWFGNLITCRWWDNVWINEGFASYFEYFAMDAVDRSLELEDQFNIMYLQSSLSSDASAGTRALQHAVNSPAQVTGHFSGISYSKGASLLLMLKHYVTEDTFRKALNYFLVDRSYEYAFPSDLYDGFARAVQEDGTIGNVNIYSFIQNWVEQPGYPVLNVNVNHETGAITLNQEQFFISATASSTDRVWPLPLTFTTQGNPNWNDLKAEHLMLERNYNITKTPGEEWVIFNVQQKNLYRVNYDDRTWELIANQLNTELNAIHFLNRAQIVDDVFALMRSGRLSYNLGFQVIDFLKRDTSYYSWYPAITGFNWLRNRFLHLPDVLAEYDTILYGFLDAVISDLGYEFVATEPLTRTLNRFFVLSFACNIGHSGCVSDAVQKFNNYRNNGVRVDPNIRRHVFCEGLRAGGYNEWRFLYDRRQRSNNQADEVAMLRALGCTTNDQARQEYLAMVLDDDVVKAQDRSNAFSFLMMGDRSNANVLFQFFKQNHEAIRQSLVLPAGFTTLISNMASYMDEEALEDMESWMRSNQDVFPEAALGISSVASARASQQWGTDNSDIVLTAARGSAYTIMPTITLILTTLLAMMLR